MRKQRAERRTVAIIVVRKRGECSAEQVGRGLYGPLIVDEHDPIRVDRDVTWVLDDWRLSRDASISDDFGNMHGVSHDGRVGNTVTVNGRIPETFTVR